MALNPFFLQGSSNEQYLIQDLINEQLKIYGIDVYYLPRKFMRTDNILNEVETSKFDDNFILEAYLENYEGYAPGSDLMTKFGLRLKNEINLVISRERFEEFIVPMLKGRDEAVVSGNITDYEMNLVTRPKEGDLIYFPLGERLFEIKRVEFEKPFYQLGKNYVYELQCELYEYENEDIDTSIEDIDRTVEDEGYITSLILGGTQTNATANSSIDDGVVSQIVLVDDGSSYSSTPTIGISSSPTGDPLDNATAVAITTSVGNVKSIESILITFGGRGYNTSNPPLIAITGGGGTGAAATSVVSNGAVNKFTITNNGSEYYSEPTVTVTGPSVGQTATAKATFNSSTGKVTEIQIVNAGFGYTQAPTVQISAASTISTSNIAAASTSAYAGTAGLNALNGVSIEPNGTGVGVTGGFNIGQSYLGFVGLADSRHAILTPIDSSNFDTMTINAIVGNDSNGGEDPDIEGVEELRLHYLESGGSSFKSISINPAGVQALSASADIIIPIGAGIGTLQDFSIDIPSYAKGDGFTYMLYQKGNSSENHDHYGITNIKFESPAIGVGTYIYNETVTGSLSGTTAEVRYYNSRTDLDINNPPGDLRVAINSGQFSPGEIIVGSTSSARYILKSYDNDSYEESYDKNEEFETEADSILDFTEVNPFGEF